MTSVISQEFLCFGWLAKWDLINEHHEKMAEKNREKKREKIFPKNGRLFFEKIGVRIERWLFLEKKTKWELLRCKKIMFLDKIFSSSCEMTYFSRAASRQSKCPAISLFFSTIFSKWFLFLRISRELLVARTREVLQFFSTNVFIFFLVFLESCESPEQVRSKKWFSSTDFAGIPDHES